MKLKIRQYDAYPMATDESFWQKYFEDELEEDLRHANQVWIVGHGQRSFLHYSEPTRVPEEFLVPREPKTSSRKRRFRGLLFNMCKSPEIMSVNEVSEAEEERRYNREKTGFEA